MNASFDSLKWLSDFRRKQLQEFMQKGFPTSRDELWKYTEIKEKFIPKTPGVFREIKQAKKDDVTLVFVNGHFAEHLSNIKSLPKEVTCCSISQALHTDEKRIKPYLLREFDGARSPFAKLNSAMMTDGLFLAIPKKSHLQTPIYLVFMHTAQNEFFTSPRNIILADEQSDVTIIEEHFAENAQRYFTNTVTEIHAATNARVTYYKMQQDDLTATHVATIFIDQQKQSRVKTFSFSKGALLAREDLTLFQHAPGAESDLRGLYVLNQDNQHRDHHVHVDHLASQGTSSMTYKGILDKKSRAVFNGKVYVHPATQHINAHQENHNLLLSNTAEINTKPELEIYAEDVKCTHGATIGQLDPESLFYLMSRGIEKNEAHQLLTHAFAEEIYDKIDDEKIRDYIRHRMNHDDN